MCSTMYESPFITVMRGLKCYTMPVFLCNKTVIFGVLVKPNISFFSLSMKEKAPENFNDLCFNIIKY